MQKNLAVYQKFLISKKLLSFIENVFDFIYVYKLKKDKIEKGPRESLFTNVFCKAKKNRHFQSCLPNTIEDSRRL
jgi:hypothetical protein